MPKLTTQQEKDLTQAWFENYLQDAHYDLFPSLLDDELPDHYNNWVGNLSEDEIYNLSKHWHLQQSRWVAEEFIKRN